MPAFLHAYIPTYLATRTYSLANLPFVSPLERLVVCILYGMVVLNHCLKAKRSSRDENRLLKATHRERDETPKQPHVVRALYQVVMSHGN